MNSLINFIPLPLADVRLRLNYTTDAERRKTFDTSDNWAPITAHVHFPLDTILTIPDVYEGWNWD